MGCPKLTYLSAVRHDHPKLSIVKSGNRDFSFIGKEVADAYVYGFQGQEKDDEIKGKGNSVNYTFRMHDTRLGRFLSIDPLISKFPHYSPYGFSGNKVIAHVELEGLEDVYFTLRGTAKVGLYGVGYTSLVGVYGDYHGSTANVNYKGYLAHQKGSYSLPHTPITLNAFAAFEGMYNIQTGKYSAGAALSLLNYGALVSVDSEDAIPIFPVPIDANVSSKYLNQEALQVHQGIKVSEKGVNKKLNYKTLVEIADWWDEDAIEIELKGALTALFNSEVADRCWEGLEGLAMDKKVSYSNLTYDKETGVYSVLKTTTSNIFYMGSIDNLSSGAMKAFGLGDYVMGASIDVSVSSYDNVETETITSEFDVGLQVFGAIQDFMKYITP